MSSPLSAYAERYRANLFESVIPFWERHSSDREYGGFVTCLERDGPVYDPRKYVWLQGRQIWLFSRLYNEVEARPEWLDTAAHGMDFLTRHARDSQGRHYFRLEPCDDGDARYLDILPGRLAEALEHRAKGIK